VETVLSGENLVDKVINSDNQYQAIITDYNMGGCTGLEASQEIRNAGIKTPIYLFTGSNIDTEEARKKGVTKVFNKMDYECLVNTVIESYKE
ncbi:MAG: response regulator, partial [Nanoarchaeota archaeon]